MVRKSMIYLLVATVQRDSALIEFEKQSKVFLSGYPNGDYTRTSKHCVRATETYMKAIFHKNNISVKKVRNLKDFIVLSEQHELDLPFFVMHSLEQLSECQELLGLGYFRPEYEVHNGKQDVARFFIGCLEKVEIFSKVTLNKKWKRNYCFLDYPFLVDIESYLKLWLKDPLNIQCLDYYAENFKKTQKCWDQQ